MGLTINKYSGTLKVWSWCPVAWVHPVKYLVVVTSYYISLYQWYPGFQSPVIKNTRYLDIGNPDTQCPVIWASCLDTECPVTKCPDTESLVIYISISRPKKCLDSKCSNTKAVWIGESWNLMLRYLEFWMSRNRGTTVLTMPASSWMAPCTSCPSAMRPGACVIKLFTRVNYWHSKGKLLSVLKTPYSRVNTAIPG